MIHVLALRSKLSTGLELTVTEHGRRILGGLDLLRSMAGMKKHNVSYVLCILSFVSTLFLTSASYADLGLSSEDFESKAVSGEQVTGTAITLESEGDPAPVVDFEGFSDGNPGPDGAMCGVEQGNAASESKANTCENDQCMKVYSYVNLFTRQYQDEKVDMSVKTAGGFVKVHRVYADGKWQFEHEYNRLDVSEIDTGVIHKSNLTYRRDTDNLFHYKTFTIKGDGDLFRWENKSGDYVLYSREGLMAETGNRIGVLSLYTYEKGKLIIIQDRHNVPIYHFNYNENGKVA